MDQLQTIAQVNRRFAFGVVILVLSLLFVIPVDLKLSKIPNYFDKAYISENFVVPLEGFRPEQAERAQYLFTLISLPSFILIFGVLNSKWKFLHFLTVRNHNLIVYISALVVIILGCLDFRLYALYYFDSSPLFSYPLTFFGIAIVFIIATLYFNKWINSSTDAHRIRLVNFVYFLLVILTLLIVLPLLVARRGNLVTNYFFDGSFDAYFYSIVQVIKGKTFLVNLNSQYGLYPYFLLPVIKLIGLDISVFSVLQIVLYSIFLTMFLLVLEKLVQNPWIKLLCLLTYVYLMHVLGFFHTPYYYYYQYVPHRLVTPALIILVSLFYYQDGKLKRILYLLGFLVSSIALLWNLDTGIPVFGVWVLSLLFNELIRNAGSFKKFFIHSLRHILVAILFVIGSSVLLLVYTIYRSGFFPNIKDYLFYQGVFYGNGYFMLPMSLFHPWNLVILVYLVGIIQSVFYLGSKLFSDQPGDAISVPDHWKRMMVFALSIIGVGLFGYYQGRSHPIVLPAVLWPALLLVAIYISDLGNLLARVKGINISPHLNRLAGISLIYSSMVFVFFSFAMGAVANVPLLLGYSYTQFTPFQSNYPPNFQSEIDFINAHTKTDKTVLILANNAGILYAETNTYNPLAIPGVTELMSRQDLIKIINYVNDPTTEKLFIEPEVLSRYPDLLESLSKSHLNVTRIDETNSIVLYSAG